MSVKRRDFIRHLEGQGCALHRHGSKHDIYVRIATGKKTTVPRHNQIDKALCGAICKQLGVSLP